MENAELTLLPKKGSAFFHWLNLTYYQNNFSAIAQDTYPPRFSSPTSPLPPRQPQGQT
jgi:hypothetical protein